MAELQPTYGNFTLRGQVVWLDRNNAYDESTSGNGYLYRRIRFGVKTEEKNIVQVELFQTKFDTVTLQNKETKQRDKEVPYGEHHNLPEGYQLFMPIHLGIEQDEEGNNIKKQLIPFDAIKYIKENLKNGDTVFIFGSPRFSEYTNRDGNMISQVSFEPRGIYLTSTPFEDEEFEGQSTFEQTIVLNALDLDKKVKKAYVSAFVIVRDFGELKTIPVQFWIDGNKYLGLIKNLQKLPFGTEIRVEGRIHSKPVYTEVEEVDDSWGERSFSTTQQVISGVDKSMEITFANPNTIEESKYSHEDLFPPQAEDDSSEDNPFKETEENSDWGVPADKSSETDDEDDPFADLDEF